MSKKSKKELAKAEAILAKALKMQAKAKKMKDEAAQMQLAMLQSSDPSLAAAAGNSGALNIMPQQEEKASPGAGAAPASNQEEDADDSMAQIGRHLSRGSLIRYIALGAAIILVGIFIGYAVAKRARPAGAKTAQDTKTATANEKPEPQKAVSTVAAGLEVLDKWELPDELHEISGNVFIDAERMACIEDNEGIIHTYNLSTRQVEKRLQFGKPGDYEALAKVNDTFYVLRSDGLLFEVRPAANGKAAVAQYQLPLRAANETESLFYDSPNRRLLLAVKEKDPQSNDYKGVYSFDLARKAMGTKPVMTIPAEHMPAGGAKKNKARSIKPSEIALDPRSGNLFVLNGPQAEFLIVSPDGSLKQAIELDKDDFPQPEGMCFSESGELYLSSEGSKKSKGIIAKVRLNQ